MRLNHRSHFTEVIVHPRTTHPKVPWITVPRARLTNRTRIRTHVPDLASQGTQSPSDPGCESAIFIFTMLRNSSEIESTCSPQPPRSLASSQRVASLTRHDRDLKHPTNTPRPKLQEQLEGKAKTPDNEESAQLKNQHGPVLVFLHVTLMRRAYPPF